MLRESPFHARTAPLCEAQNWRRWAGYLAASSYDLVHDREYHAIRNTAALIDVSPLYKYRVAGRDAAQLLDRIVTRNVSAAKIGQVLYTTWCDGDGKVIDDGTVTRLDEHEFRMTAAEPTFRWLGDNARGLAVDIADVTDSVAALALQGPMSRTILEHATECSLSGLRYFRATRASVRGAPVTITRTGFTGDLGYEIWMDAASAVPVWDALIACGVAYGVVPAGMLALDMARVEAGLLLADVDYISARKALIPEQMSSPYELGLGWTVALEKEHFVGHRALRNEQARGAAWQFVGVEVDWPSLERLYADMGLAPRLPTAAWRTSVPLYDGGTATQVGYCSSGSWSPLLKRMIALAHVETRSAAPGTEVRMEVTVEHRRQKARARIAPLPFFSPQRKRA